MPIPQAMQFFVVGLMILMSTYHEFLLINLTHTLQDTQFVRGFGWAMWRGGCLRNAPNRPMKHKCLFLTNFIIERLLSCSFESLRQNAEQFI